MVWGGQGYPLRLSKREPPPQKGPRGWRTGKSPSMDPGGAVVAPYPTSFWSRPMHRDACATSAPQIRGAASPSWGGGGGAREGRCWDGCCGCQATCTGGTLARARAHETALPGPAGNATAASKRGQTQRDRQTDPVTGDAATCPHSTAPGAQRGDGAPAFPSSGIPQPTHRGPSPATCRSSERGFLTPCSG